MIDTPESLPSDRKTVLTRRIFEEVAQYLPKRCSRKKPPHFLLLMGPFARTLLLEQFALTNSLLLRVNSTCKGSQTPRFVEHFWVSFLGPSCSNRLFVGTLRPSQSFKIFAAPTPITEIITGSLLCRSGFFTFFSNHHHRIFSKFDLRRFAAATVGSSCSAIAA